MSHRYRLYPERVQLQMLDRHCADARFVWNLALEQANCYRPSHPAPGSAERNRQLADARKETWLGEGSSSVQQQALRDFDRAMANWWGGSHRRPTWRAKGKHDGFCVRDVTVKKLNRRWATVAVPKLGPVRFRLSRPLPDKVGMARVTLDAAGRWHVSFTATPKAIVRQPTGAIVGIDRGVATTLATSEGAMFRIPTTPKLESKVVRLNRQLARQKKGSARRAKTKVERARALAKITDRRRDWVEKTSTRLVRDYDVIVLEDLHVKNMVRAPKPKLDPECPGAYLPNGAKSKAGLNRSIHRSCWGLFLQRLQDKTASSGVQVLLVNPAYTSQQCRHCGHTASENRKSQAVFECVRCGHVNHADTNAAENIVARGLALAPTPGHGAGPGNRSARVSPPRAAARTSGRTAA